MWKTDGLSKRVLLVLSVVIATFSIFTEARARTGPDFYERRVVPNSGRDYCIARWAKTATSPLRASVSIYRRHSDQEMPAPGARRWPLAKLAIELPINEDILAGPQDLVEREVFCELPPQQIRLSTTGLGAALVGTPTIYADVEMFGRHPFLTVVPLKGPQTFPVMLSSIFTSEEIVVRTAPDGILEFFFNSWIDENRHRLIMTETQGEHLKSVTIVDLRTGLATRGTPADIVQSLDNHGIDALCPAIRSASIIPGGDVEQLLLALVNKDSLAVGARAYAAWTLRQRGNPAGEGLLRELRQEYDELRSQDPRVKGWISMMPLLAEEIGFTPSTDRWLALRVSQVGDVLR